jgi:copper transport protein
VASRFSVVCGVAFTLLLLSGAVQAIVEVASVRALAETAFGRAVLVKLVLAVVLVAVGWLNRARLLPALRAADATSPYAGVLLRRTLRLELALGAVALAVTGALAGYAPA